MTEQDGPTEVEFTAYEKKHNQFRFSKLINPLVAASLLFGYLTTPQPIGRSAASELSHTQPIAAEYLDLPLVTSDILFDTDLFPNDPLYGEQWNLNPHNETADQFGSGWIEAWRLAKVNPPAQTDEILIAMLDAGANIDHPDLHDVIWINEDEIPNNGIDDDKNGYVDDINGCNFISGATSCEVKTDTTPNQHGTGTAGIYGAQTNNSIGIAGEISGLSNSKITLVKVMQDSGVVNYSSVKAGLEYAQTINARVIVMNFAGWPVSPLTELNAIIQELHNNGVIIIAGTGNSYGITGEEGVGWPARNSNVIAVGAYGQDGLRWPKSSTGAEIWITAPGVNIPTTCYDGTPFFDYCYQTGTSFVAPQVAAAAAFALSYSPDMTPDQFREMLKVTSGNVWTPEMGYGPLRFDQIAKQLGLRYHLLLPIIFK